MSDKVSLHGFDASDQRRIKAIAAKLVAGLIERGEIECSDAAIRSAMPKALRDAKEAVAAVNEYLCG